MQYNEFPKHWHQTNKVDKGRMTKIYTYTVLLAASFNAISQDGIIDELLVSDPYKTRASWYYVFVSTSLVVISVFLWSYGFIGLRLWTY